MGFSAQDVKWPLRGMDSDQAGIVMVGSATRTQVLFRICGYRRARVIIESKIGR